MIILWAVNMSEGADTSNLIATSVIGAVILGKLINWIFTNTNSSVNDMRFKELFMNIFSLSAFYFYVWLCVVSHFQTIKEITDLGLLDKGASGAVLPFVNEDGDGYSNKTADSTVNMRDDEDNDDDGDGDDDDKDDEKEELESISDDDKKDDDPEDPKEDNRPKSSASRAKSARSTTSSIVADTRPDAEEE